MPASRLKSIAKRYLPARLTGALRQRITRAKVLRAEPGSWIGANLRYEAAEGSDLARVEALAARTEAMGATPLWEGYEAGGVRTPSQVRTDIAMGRFYTFIVTERRPKLIVEFGTAFGVSGMYWLAGLKRNGSGHLLTFEPNERWAAAARANLTEIGSRFTLTPGTFEDNLAVVDRFPERIDIGFIDAIHTSAFVLPQLELVAARAAPGALIFFDDITFSDDMQDCWRTIAARPHYAAAAEIGNRVGVIELGR